MNGSDPLQPPSKAVLRWKALSLATSQGRMVGHPLRINDALRQAADEPGLRTLHPALLGWVGENYFHAARFTAAIDVAQELRRLHPTGEWAQQAHLLEAQSWMRLGDIDRALRAYEAAAEGESDIALAARFDHAQLLERNRKTDQAVE